MTNNFLNERISGIARVFAKQHKGGISFWILRYAEQDIKIVFERADSNNYDEVTNITIGSLIAISGYKSKTEGKFVEQVYRIEQIILIKSCKEDKLSRKRPFKYLDSGIGANSNLAYPRYTAQKQLATYKNYRYSNRVVDILTHKEVFDYIKRISCITQCVRRFLLLNHYYELNTGVLQDFFEAGFAEPFITKHNLTNKILYLSMTSELKLTRMMVAGFENIFEFVQSFKNGGLDSLHALEFTMVEVFSVQHNYTSMSILLEKLIRYVADEFESSLIPPINAQQPFEWLTFEQALVLYADYDGKQPILEFLVHNFPTQFNIAMPSSTWVGKAVKKLITPNIIQPTFIHCMPTGLSPLIKEVRGFSEKANLIINGMNIADVHSNETDTGIIRERFENQAKLNQRPVNRSYLEVLDIGLANYSSLGLALNRFLLLFRGYLPFDVNETVLFPLK